MRLRKPPIFAAGLGLAFFTTAFSQSTLDAVKSAERRENLKTCLSGLYPNLCNHELLDSAERAHTAADERQSIGPARSTEAPVKASATITSTPTLADIEIDGKYAGSTKLSIKFTPGTHAVTIKRNGYEPWSRTIEVTEGSELTINADLQPTKKEPAQDTTSSKK